jgi:CRISPR-associated protein Cmr2
MHFGLSRDQGLPRNEGRLHFIPTFLDKIALEVINPHDRCRRVGINPIYFEAAPVGAKGKFALLYTPFDLIADATKDICAEAKHDLFVVCNALKAMFLDYGFSAKKSSGFGIARPKIENGFVKSREMFKVIKDINDLSKIPDWL